MRMRTYKRSSERQSWPLSISKVGSPSKVAKKRRLSSLAVPPPCGLKDLSPIKGLRSEESSWPSPHKRQVGDVGGCVKKGGHGGGGDRDTTRRHRGGEERKLLQMYLDFGQSNFGRRKVCNVCGMMWVQGAPDDEAQHEAFCSSFLKGIPFLGWRKERVAAEWPEDGRGEGARVVEIRPNDPSKHLSKLKEVLKQADADMGFARRKEEVVKQRAFIYISGKRVVGCILAEAINSERLLLKDAEHGSSTTEPQSKTAPDKETAAMVGIYQMWTHQSYRRKGIATRLLDTVRQRFVWGMNMGREALAFSQPTTDGLALAQAYCGSEKRVSTYTIKQ